MTKKKSVSEKPKKIARQDDLPGMEDRTIKALEDAALDYAEIRDERQALTLREAELKTKLIDLMHQLKKTEYQKGNISISLVVEKEKVRVRVKKEESDES